MTQQMALPLNQQYWQWRQHRICYSVLGTGQPLMLVHGFGGAIGHWRKNIPVLAAAGYQVYAIDLLGFGDSGKPDLAYSLELWQTLLQDFWAAHIQTPTVFIGNSIGGLLCLSLAANAPEITKGVALLNCAGGLSHRPQEFNWPLRWMMSGFSRLVRSRLFGPFLFDRIRQKSRIRATLKQIYSNPDAVTDELVELLYRPSCDPGAQRVFASVVTAGSGPKISDLLPQVNCPLLVIWGEADPWIPTAASQIFQDWNQETATSPQNQRSLALITLPETGHCPHDDRPEWVNPLMIDWLNQSISGR
jgi:pimeloyl-ACP methyl ester carboxylesterase